MSAEPRDKRLADYNELLEGLLEMVAMQEDAGGDDEELRSLIADAEAQLSTLAASLNAEETIAPTPGLIKVLLPPATAGKDSTGAEQQANESPVVLFPPADQPRLSAPYEVRFDERSWYPCVITAVVPPAAPTDRLTYKAWILGYNIEETVLSEALRPWGKTQESERKDATRSGAACHAICPSTGRFVPATIERLTLDSTVMVTFENPSQIAAAEASKSVELPLSHVHTAAKFYQVLRKRPQLSEDEKRERRQENARRKRARAEEERQMKADKVEQDASDWQALMSDMMGGGGRKRRF